MKLAIVTAGFKPVPAVRGGAVEQLVTNIVYANEENHYYDIDLYTLYDKKLAHYDFKYTNIIGVHNPQSNFIIRVFHYLYRKIMYPSDKRINYLSQRMARKFKKNYYDIVLVENNMDTYNYLYSLKMKEKFYFHLHNDFDNGDREKTKSNTKNIIKTADGILAVSNYLKLKLENYGAKKVKVVSNYVEDNQLKKVSKIEKAKIRNQYGITSHDIVFTYIGRLSVDKGIDKLVDAMLLLKDEKNIKCLIVGDNFFGSKEEKIFNSKLKEKVLPLKEKFIFTGFIDNKNLYKIYEISDCIVIPSQVEEAFGMVALEAMRMKKAIIASDAGALPEIIPAEGSIIIKRNRNYVYNLANSIKEVSRDRYIRQEMGRKNYVASEKFPHNKEEYFHSVIKSLEQK